MRFRTPPRPGISSSAKKSLADDINDDYKKLPQLTAQYRGDRQPFEIDPIGLVQYSNFDTDEENRVIGQRLYAEAGATYPMNWQYGFLRSTAKYRLLGYQLDRQIDGLDENPGAASALASIDGGLFFERQTSLAGRNVLQTLEPRVFYLYSQFDEQTDQPDFDSAELTFNYNQLFRDTRFSGRDRLDDANQVSIGLTSRFLDEDTGEERFNAMQAFMGSFIGTALAWAAALVMSYHLFGGIRHLLWDSGRFMSKEEIRSTGVVTVIATLALWVAVLWGAS